MWGPVNKHLIPSYNREVWIRRMLKDKQAMERTQEFTWFTAEGYVHRVAANFIMMEKIIQKTFTMHRYWLNYLTLNLRKSLKNVYRKPFIEIHVNDL
jgi:hypothetical protein